MEGDCLFKFCTTYMITFWDGDVSFAEKLLSIILEIVGGAGRQDRRRGREGKYLMIMVILCQI